jgi:hypothetical protein
MQWLQLDHPRRGSTYGNRCLKATGVAAGDRRLAATAAVPYVCDPYGECASASARASGFAAQTPGQEATQPLASTDVPARPRQALDFV